MRKSIGIQTWCVSQTEDRLIAGEVFFLGTKPWDKDREKYIEKKKQAYLKIQESMRKKYEKEGDKETAQTEYPSPHIQVCFSTLVWQAETLQWCHSTDESLVLCGEMSPQQQSCDSHKGRDDAWSPQAHKHVCKNSSVLNINARLSN